MTTAIYDAVLDMHARPAKKHGDRNRRRHMMRGKLDPSPPAK